MRIEPNAPAPGVSAPAGRLLLADDDAAFRSAFARELVRAGYSCAEAATGSETLELLNQAGADAVIAEIRMPGNEQLELVTAVAELTPGTPTILLTGYPTVETAVRSVQLPVFAYLCKPLESDELYGVLKQAVLSGRMASAVRASRRRTHMLDAELAQLERRLLKPALPGREPTEGFLRVAMQGVVSSILDMEKCMALLVEGGMPREQLERAELVAALRETVEVLEQTKQSFKSKALGDLRRRVEELLKAPARTDALDWRRRQTRAFANS
jgi:ActR/RegA family two-component response regulator